MGCPKFWDNPLHIFAVDNAFVELKIEVMAGLFLLFIMAILLGEMLRGYFKAQESTDDTNAPSVIIFTPDDDVYEWEPAPKQ